MKTLLSLVYARARHAALIAFALGAATAMPAGAQSLTISTLAGYAGKGSNDGVGNGARFLNPQSVAVDSSGNVYVADTGNNTIRMVTGAGVSSTLAGTPGIIGSANGTGPSASFNQPSGIALDNPSNPGNLYVTEYGNNTVRQITLSGHVVSTFAGSGSAGSGNNTGTNATFYRPMGIAVDSATNLYVADYGNHLIRKINTSKVVSTLAGSAGVAGTNDASGTSAQFNCPEAVAVDSSGNVYVADTGNGTVRKITSGVVTTFAGSPGMLGSTDGVGPGGLFFQPAGIAVNSAGTIYVSDFFNNTIRQISSGASVVTLAGYPGTTGNKDAAGSSARFWAPQGLAVVGTGNIYIADSANSEIRIMSPAGTVTTLAGSSSAGTVNGGVAAARFFNPQSLAVDSSTNIYVADTANSVIRKITPGGTVTLFAGTPGAFGSANGPGSSALFSAPQGIAVDASGYVYVADTGNHTIRFITPGGSVNTLAGLAGNAGVADGTGSAAHFNSPEGVAVDSSGNVYVADTQNHTIRKISGGVSSTLAGLPGVFGTFDGTNGDARFNCPTGIAVDPSGNIYVTDFNNNTIRAITPAGAVTTIAGWAGMWGNSDGTGTNGLFLGPAGISVDATSNLYVVDTGNSTLRKISSAGVVSTIAGLAGFSGSTDGTGSAAQFFYPAGVAVAGGYVYIADSANNTIRSQSIPPSITSQPQSVTNVTGNPATFSVGIYGSSPLTYTWKYNGVTTLPFNSSSILVTNAGSYQVIVTNAAGQVTSTIATLTLTNGTTGAPGVFQSYVVQGNGVVHFALTGTPSASYHLQASTNLQAWTNVYSFTMTNGSVQLNDTTAPSYPTHFYRLVTP